MNQRQLSTITYPVAFLMVDSTDHVTGKAGITPAVTISKNGAAFAAPAGAVTELANGWFLLAGNATDRNTLGTLLVHATGTGADPTDVVLEIVTRDPFATATQTGDAYARLGAAGAGLTALGDARIANLDALVSSRSTYTGGAVASVSGSVGSVTAPVTVGSLSAGAITSAAFTVGSVSAAATGLLERLTLLFYRFFPLPGGSVTSPKSGNGSQVVKGTAGATLATLAVSDDGTTQTLGPAS